MQPMSACVCTGRFARSLGKRLASSTLPVRFLNPC